MKYFPRDSILQENSMLRNFNFTHTNTLRAMMLSILLILSLSAVTAWAASLQDLRASGAIGESASGYVVARDPGAKGDAAAINKKRKAVYAEKASAQGVGVDQVGKVYAREIFKKVPKGTWLQNEKGQWQQK